MLVSESLDIAAPCDVVRDHLLALGHGEWVDRAEAAYADAERFMTLRATTGRLSLTKRVHVDIGPPMTRCGATVIPVSWCATGATRLFPTLEADLEIRDDEHGGTTVTLVGHYEPPLGALGRGLDRMLMHRVAQASVRGFLAGVTGKVPVPA